MIDINNKYKLGSSLANIIIHYTNRLDMIYSDYNHKQPIIKLAETMKPYIKLDPESSKIIKIMLNNRITDESISLYLVDHDKILKPSENIGIKEYTEQITPYYIGYNNSLTSDIYDSPRLSKCVADIVIFTDSLKQIMNQFIYFTPTKDDPITLSLTFSNNDKLNLLNYTNRIKNETELSWMETISRSNVCNIIISDLIESISKLLFGEHHDFIPGYLDSIRIDFLNTLFSKIRTEEHKDVYKEDIIENMIMNKYSTNFNNLINKRLEIMVLIRKDKFNGINEIMEDLIKNSNKIKGINLAIDNILKKYSNEFNIYHNALSELDKESLYEFIDPYILDNLFIKYIKSNLNE